MSYTILFFICLIFIYIKCNEGAFVDDDLQALFEGDDEGAKSTVFRGDDKKSKNRVQFSTKPIKDIDIENRPVTKHINLKSKDSNNFYPKSFNDEYWQYQWYAHDTRTEHGPVMDHNLVPVYLKGITGRGVIVGIIGDGVKRGLDDLKNVKKPDSKNFPVSKRKQADPDKNSKGEINSEGTKMAGVIAMNANNSICGVGVAFNADIVGIQAVSQYYLVYTQAIIYGQYERKQNKEDVPCDIYAFAFGRPDDGTYMNNVKQIGEAFYKGAKTGRQHKGSIYVVGAGNGKASKDNCGADDLANDRHTLVIASADHRGKVTPYSERCAAVTATAYSSGDGLSKDEAVVTLDSVGTCTKFYTGNYPSVGIAAGIIALVLESNPRLTARDIQHLIAMTSEVAPLADNTGTWKENDAGFYISNDFGFGLLNAENMVNLAKNWISVPPMKTDKENFELDPKKEETALDHCCTNRHHVSFYSEITYSEIVELIVTARLEFRGSLNLVLKSPTGTKVVMLEPRRKDRSVAGLKNWKIKTAHFWGENPVGQWELSASIEKFPKETSWGLGGLFNYLSQKVTGSSPNEIKKVKIVVHGTILKPEIYPPYEIRRKRQYSSFSIW